MTSGEFKERVNKYHAFENHPLKDQYLEEKEKLKAKINEGKSYKRLSIAIVIMIIMIPVFFFIFIETMDGGYITTILGILNIVGLILIIIAKENMVKNDPAYIAFTEKYKELGVIEFTESDVEKGGCIDEYGCCAVTGRTLSVEERAKCREAHCHKCKTFMRAAYGYTEEEFSEMEMIHE